MLFRVKTQRFKSSTGHVFENFHWLPVGKVFHNAAMSDPWDTGKDTKVQVVLGTYDQTVPMQCLERIPNTKANLRKFAKGLL